MSDELKKLYKVIQPVVFSVRREIGELLQLTAEEAEHLAAFIVPADEQPANTDNQTADAQKQPEQQNQNQEQNQSSDQSQNTDQNQTQSGQTQTDQNQNQNGQPSNTEGGQTGDQSQQTA